MPTVGVKQEDILHGLLVRTKDYLLLLEALNSHREKLIREKRKLEVQGDVTRDTMDLISNRILACSRLRSDLFKQHTGNKS